MKKKNILNWWIACLCICGLAGCEHSDIMMYEELPGVYFNGASWTYSFLDKPGTVTDTIKLPILITGSAVDYDRKVTAEAVADSNTTIREDLYELLEGTVRKGEFEGILPVVVKYIPEYDTSVVTLKLKLIASADFNVTTLGVSTNQVKVTGKVIQPANWSWLKYYFGTPYSTAWWKFIIEVTGRSSLPYYPSHPDKETWNMTVNELKAYQEQVRMALAKYNADPSHPKLTHDDGQWKGQLVSMP